VNFIATQWRYRGGALPAHQSLIIDPGSTASHRLLIERDFKPLAGLAATRRGGLVARSSPGFSRVAILTRFVRRPGKYHGASDAWLCRQGRRSAMITPRSVACMSDSLV
jgi:hypothetical protein